MSSKYLDEVFPIKEELFVLCDDICRDISEWIAVDPNRSIVPKLAKALIKTWDLIEAIEKAEMEL